MPIKSYPVWFYFVVCNRCHIAARSDDECDQEHTEKEAEANGWKIDRSSDDEREWYILCPKCIEKQPEVG